MDRPIYESIGRGYSRHRTPDARIVQELARLLELPKDSTLDLTQRQKEVMRLMAQGESNKQIARRLNVTENTVKVHVTAILRELNVTSRAQAIVALFQRGDGPS